ncbi:hypothetical protein [Albimonas donghaensis]|nr:hypothetical protein [Albimonas donghaensis]
MTSADIKRGWRALLARMWSMLSASALALAVSATLGAGAFVANWMWRGAVAELLFGALQDNLGITALAAAQDDLAQRIAVLEPPRRIVRFDPSLSYIVDGACVQGQECEAVFLVRRTPFGATCEPPLAVPMVANHGGREHPAERRSVVAWLEGDEWDRGAGAYGVKSGEAWTLVRLIFVVPLAALPGRAVYFSRLDYDCAGVSQPTQESIRLPFEILSGA